MKKIMILLVNIFLGLSSYAQISENDIIGQWTNETNSQVIEFVKNNSTYDAIILESDDASVLGRKQITNLKFHEDGKYSDGTIYFHRKGRTADCTATFLGPKELKLKIKYGFLSKSAIWNKVENK